MSGFIETLQGPARDDVKARERFLAIMQEQAHRMARLIDDLLSLSRIELNAHRRPDKPVDLVPIVRQVVDGLETLSRDRGVNVNVEGEHALLILGDRDELVRLFSGVKWDIRKALPYANYKNFDFDIPTGENGDTYDRYLVRMAEFRQSLRIIEQAVEGIPEGPIMAKVPKVIKPPVGEVYHSIEAPKGELGYFIVSDGSTQPYRIRVRPPSFVNLQALEVMCRGAMVADVVAVIGTLDIVLGEVDR